MSDLFYPIRTDMDDFYNAVKLLSDSVNRSGIDWKDEKYKELAGKIQELATFSSQIIQAGEESKTAMRVFESIAQEE